MEKEPKKSAAESTSRQAETSDREPEAGSSPCESPEPHPGILREIGKEAREQVRPNQGYLKIDYFTLFWLFVAGSVFGLVVETAFHAIVYGGYESRAGLVWGPFSPIYGVGAVALTVSLNRFYHSHNLIIFLIAMLLGSVMEYATSWLMEVLWGAIAWDYTGTFGSINGRTNFAFGVMWGLLGLVWVRTILPFIKRVFSHVDARSMLARLVTAALSLFMALNIAVTLLALDREGQRAAGVPATTWEQRFFDERFPDSYLQSRMQNMSVYGKGSGYRRGLGASSSNARTSSPAVVRPVLREARSSSASCRSAGRLSAKRRLSPVTGCWNDSWNECRNWRSRPRSAAGALWRARRVRRVAHKEGASRTPDARVSDGCAL